ncbi:MAG: hypothetical protein GF344_15960 [Chitinivibrionales bacterium]|nr:hypothetical protein [Chitinivibrionales bacterium]MBD3358190.1 hypothetical protein [Chitinivibrionales bacterium]
MQRHINIVAGLYIALSILLLLITAFLVAVVTGAAPLIDVDAVEGIVIVIAWIIAVFWVAVAAAGIAIGAALKQRHSWARIATIVVSIVNLLNFPIGTAVGLYALWVMLNPETIRLFDRSR